MFWFFGPEEYGILAARSGIKSACPALVGEVLTTGLPGKPSKDLYAPVHWTKQSPPHPQLPVLAPLLSPHLGPWPPAALPEMSRQYRSLQEAMQSRSRQLEEEVEGLREQLGRLPRGP